MNSHRFHLWNINRVTNYQSFFDKFNTPVANPVLHQVLFFRQAAIDVQKNKFVDSKFFQKTWFVISETALPVRNK